jgi:hypothetical protein
MKSAWEILSENFKIPEKHKDKMKGGIADKKQPKDFCPKQLSMGVKTEKEHTNNMWTALEIAMDHLSEDPKYYTHLADMEKKHQDKDQKGEE